MAQIGYVCIFLAVFGILFLHSAMKNLQSSGTLRTIKPPAVKENMEVSQNSQTQCEIPELRVPKDDIPSSFLTSYPGSGTRLQWKLVRAITGVVTTDDTFSNGHHNVVGITTHFPHPAGREFPGAEKISKAIVFISHPLHTIPSYHDIIRASEKDVKTFPPPRAPLHEWLDWRDLNFLRELEAWSKHITYWIDRYSYSNCLVVPYEQLLTRDHGPPLTMKMSELLASDNPAASTANESDIPCIWKKVLEDTMNSENSLEVQNDSEETIPRDQQELPSSTKAEERILSMKTEPLDVAFTEGDTNTESNLYKLGAYVKDAMRPYTESQRKEAVVVLTQLLERYSDNDTVASLLVEYIDQIVNVEQD